LAESIDRQRDNFDDRYTCQHAQIENRTLMRLRRSVLPVCDAMHRTEDSRPDLKEPWILSLDSWNEIRETKTRLAFPTCMLCIITSSEIPPRSVESVT